MKRLLVFVLVLVLLITACGKDEFAYTDNGNPGQIKAFVFVDSNQNGVLDSGEKKLPTKVSISQEVSCPPTSQPTWVDTDANGEYLFDKLKPGKYCVIQLSDYNITSKMTPMVYVSSDTTTVVTWTVAP
ncbi:MAG: SdrD B-like domain-containing protein [Anaerolineales bacterium]